MRVINASVFFISPRVGKNSMTSGWVFISFMGATSAAVQLRKPSLWEAKMYGSGIVGYMLVSTAIYQTRVHGQIPQNTECHYQMRVRRTDLEFTTIYKY